ncbi:MAG: B12-binding domain-containing radical SAM protein [Bacteroidales bacterium]|nr:B12-binding domain-containing radical SAM protein [Bacteroidales bacterium]
MKTLLASLNAKYIHTSLALRWLYVVNKDKFDISFREFTIKEELEIIVKEILKTNCDILGLSVSIWNVAKSKDLCSILKKQNPKLIIILGGPEVSYEPDFFIKNWDINYVVSGEGEFVLGDLLTSIQINENIYIPAVSSKEKISKEVAKANIEKLVDFPSPYQLEIDKKDLKNRLVYFETSRGCPYQCQYCLSSLESGVRYFPKEYIAENLKYIINTDAKQVKFLDRTFNLNKAHTNFVFDFLLKNYRPNLSFQFEVYADLLTDETIDFLNKNTPEKYFRFEIGIQSTHEATNLAIKRKQDFSLLEKNVTNLIKGGRIDLHLDLIAGLPYESFELFVKSFNEVFKLGAKEIQLGFLKMLRGTALRNNADKYEYKYDENPPYQIISNKFLSKIELERIHDAEHALEKFWNSGRFPNTMKHLMSKEYKNLYFELFDEIASFYNKNNLPHFAYQLEDLFSYFNSFLESKNIDAKNSLRDDYYSNFSARPSSFWCNILDKKEKKKKLNEISLDFDFLNKNKLTKQIIENKTAIYPLENGKFLLSIFENKKMQQIEWEGSK